MITLRFTTGMVLAGVVCLAASGVRANLVQLDLSNGLNYDAWISAAEKAEADSYNPPGDWGMGNRLVSTVFGNHNIWSSRTFVFNDQTGGETNLPVDGVISQGTWTYQLETQRDAVPDGGWANPEYPESDPRGQMPVFHNVIQANAPHTGTANPPSSMAQFSLTAGQQGQYEAINFLITGSNHELTIYADYADGQEAIWTGQVPNPAASLNPTNFPSHADLAPAIQTTHNWGLSSNYSAIRTDHGGGVRMWMFADDGLALDPTRTLEGLTVHLTPVSWSSRSVVIYAASAVVPEPASLALVGLGGLMLLGRHRR